MSFFDVNMNYLFAIEIKLVMKRKWNVGRKLNLICCGNFGVY